MFFYIYKIKKVINIKKKTIFKVSGAILKVQNTGKFMFKYL